MSRFRTIGQRSKRALEPVGTLPNGLPMCRWCKGAVEPPKRTFCSESCVHEWKLRSNSGYLRQQVFDRDHGVCAKCGVDTVKLRRELYELSRADRLVRLEQIGLTEAIYERRNSLWDADHIIPVKDGGDISLPSPQYLLNIQSLCVTCHRNKTFSKGHG